MSPTAASSWLSTTPSAVIHLPQYVRDHPNTFLLTPARVAVIIVLALLVRMLAHRAIDRLARRVQAGGSGGRILAPLREKAGAMGERLESTLLQSERRQQRADTLASVLKNAVSLIIFVIALLTILGQVGIDLAPLLAGTSILGVAVAFGAQNVIKDFLAGMFMLLEDQYGVGDVIDVKEATGTVEAVGLRTTRLRDVHGTAWYVRNGEIVRVGNKSQGFAQVVLDVPIAADADLDLASATMLEVAEQMYAEPEWSEVFLDPPDLQGVESLTREETVIRLVQRVRPLEQWRAARELRGRIRERFDQLHIVADVATVVEESNQGFDTGEGPAADTGEGPTPHRRPTPTVRPTVPPSAAAGTASITDPAPARAASSGPAR